MVSFQSCLAIIGLSNKYEIGANLIGISQQTFWWVLVGAKASLIFAHNAGFFESNRFPCVAKVLCMVDINIGDGGNIAINHIDRVKATPKSYLEDGYINIRFGKY